MLWAHYPGRRVQAAAAACILLTAAAMLHAAVGIQGMRAKTNDLLDLGAAPGPTHTTVPMRFMWGLWQDQPLPSVVGSLHAKWAAQCGYANPTVHGRAQIERLVHAYNEEHNPKAAEAYFSITRKAGRADMGRYLLIYYLGGVYFDNDAELLRALPQSDWADGRSGVFFTETVLGNETDFGPRERHTSIRVANYALGARQPGSVLLKRILDESVRRVLALNAEGGAAWQADSDVIWATGPDVVTHVLHDQGITNDAIEKPTVPFVLFNLSMSRSLLAHYDSGSWKKGRDADGHEAPPVRNMVLGDAASSTCPAGRVVLTRLQCIAAASQMGLGALTGLESSRDPLDLWLAPNDPGGCFQFERGVYFNSAAGRARERRRLVCQLPDFFDRT